MADSNEEEHPLIFPPQNHENLHLPSPSSSTTSSSTFSISPWDDTSPPPSPIKNFPNSPFWGFWDFGFGLLCDKFHGFVRFLRSFGVLRAVFLIFRSPVGGLLVFLYFRWRRRWRKGRVGGGGDGGDQHLLRVIREKDELITAIPVPSRVHLPYRHITHNLILHRLNLVVSDGAVVIVFVVLEAVEEEEDGVDLGDGGNQHLIRVIWEKMRFV